MKIQIQLSGGGGSFGKVNALAHFPLNLNFHQSAFSLNLSSYFVHSLFHFQKKKYLSPH